MSLVEWARLCKSVAWNGILHVYVGNTYGGQWSAKEL